MKDPNDSSFNGRSYRRGCGGHKGFSKRFIAKAVRRNAKAALRKALETS